MLHGVKRTPPLTSGYNSGDAAASKTEFVNLPPNDMLQDLRVSLRMLLKSPSYTAITLATLDLIPGSSQFISSSFLKFAFFRDPRAASKPSRPKVHACQHGMPSTSIRRR